MLGIKYFVRGFWNQRVKPTPYGLRPRRPLVPPWHKSTISIHILCNISTSLVKLKWNHDATLGGATEDASQLRYYFLSETTYNEAIPIMQRGISEKFWGHALMFVFMDGAGSDLRPNLSSRNPQYFFRNTSLHDRNRLVVYGLVIKRLQVILEVYPRFVYFIIWWLLGITLSKATTYCCT